MPNHNLDPTYAEQLLPYALFVEIQERYQQALFEQELHPDFVYVKTMTSDQNPPLPVATFNLVENFESYSRNEGEILEVEIPIDQVGDFLSGLELLEVTNPDRQVVVRHKEPGHKRDRLFRISEEGITFQKESSWHRPLGPKTSREYSKALAKKLKSFKLVPFMPSPSTREADSDSADTLDS